MSQYVALFSLLGTLYGGNGQNDFGLPDLRHAAVPAGMKYYIRVKVQSSISNTGSGEEEVENGESPQDESDSPTEEATY